MDNATNDLEKPNGMADFCGNDVIQSGSVGDTFTGSIEQGGGNLDGKSLGSCSQNWSDDEVCGC